MCKKEFFPSEINDIKSKSKKIWDTLRLILPTGKKKICDIPDKRKMNNDIIENTQEICETFNEFFVNVGKTLDEKIHFMPINQCSKILGNRVQNSVFLNPPRTNVVFNLISSLKY